MVMTASCPNCGWKLAPFASRKNKRIVCPDCSSVLNLKTHEQLFKTTAMLFAVLFMILGRLDDGNSLFYLLIVLLVFAVIFVGFLKTEKLTLAHENEF